MKPIAFERLSELGHPETGLQSIGMSFPELVIDGEPSESAHVFREFANRKVVLGIWESQSGALKFDAYPFDEICIVVEGSVTLEEDGGAADSFGPGDVFLIRKGFSGIWQMPGKLRKFYVELHEPTAE